MPRSIQVSPDGGGRYIAVDRLGLRFFGDSGLDGFGFARLNRSRGPANAGGLHGRAEEACRHSAQYTPRLAAQESRSWSQAGASVQ